MRPAILARQKHAQAIMMIFCYTIGVGWGVCSLLFIEQEGTGEISVSIIYQFLLFITFGHYASMNVYFYRVWRLYYKCKLQNEFEKVRESPANLNQRSILSHFLSLTSSARATLENSNLTEQSEHLISWPRQKSVRKSWFVRYRHTFGRSRVNKAFWFLLWICECNIVFWTYSENGHTRKFIWSPNSFADYFFTVFLLFLCLIALFVFPSDDLFRIKTELRLIFFINILETVLYYIFLYCSCMSAAYLNLAICQFLILVAITYSNYRAVRNHGGFIFKWVSSYHESDSNSEGELTMTDILDSQSLFRAFQRHLKREFSLEHLNFIVAVVHFRRLCEERSKKGQNRKIMQIRGEDSVPKAREISMQSYAIVANLTGSMTSNGSVLSTSNTRASVLLQRGGVDFESPTSAPYRLSQTRISKPTPRLSWIQSQIELGADKEDTAIFIFDEYCDWGAPQEINLSKKDRDHLIQFFSYDELDQDELNNIFNPAFDSVLDLLEKDSFRRFRMHSSFSKNTRDLLVKNVYDVNPDKNTVSCRKP